MSGRYRFGDYELLPAERRLLRDKQPIKLRPRAFDLLLTLVEERGQLVTKDVLLDRVWPGLVVEESNVQVQVSGLRRLLGPDVIATVPGLGYRLAVPLRPATARLLRRRGDRQALAALPGGEAPAAPPPPASVDRLFGRERDITALMAWLAEHRMVTLLGTGGLGKTRVAQEVARRCAGDRGDAVVWVDLAPVTDAGHLGASIATAAGLDLPAADGDVMEALLDRLQDIDALLVLDNCEHLLPAAGPLVSRLLRGAAHLRLLCTSQVRLQAAGERVYRLQPLAVPPKDTPWAQAQDYSALALLVHRARAADQHFALDADTLPVAIELVRRLDGVPLAIEMAAARAPQLGMNALGGQLADWVRLLRSPQHDAPRRQSSLRATLDWSHSLLAPREQAVLRRLAPFVGSFTLMAAQPAVAQADIEPWSALDALAALADKSLLQVVPGEPPRYRLLETTRLLAQQQLAAHGETQRAEQAHGDAMAAWAEQIEQAFWQLSDRAWQVRHGADHADLLAAFDRACERRDAEVAALTGCALAWLDFLRNLNGDRVRRAEALYRLLPQASPRARAWAWHSIASNGMMALKAVSRQEVSRQAVLAWRAVDDAPGLHFALSFHAVMCARVKAFGDADAALAEARALERGDWPVRRRLWHASMTAAVWGYRRDVPRFRAASEIELQLAQEAGAELTAAWARLKLADAARVAGELDQAVALGGEVVNALRAANYPANLGLALCHLAAAWLLKGRADAVPPLAREALPLMWANDWAHLFLDMLALYAAQAGRAADAARLLGSADAWYAAHGEARLPNEAQLEQHAQGLILPALGQASLQALRAQGAALADAQVRRLSLAVIADDGGTRRAAVPSPAA